MTQMANCRFPILFPNDITGRLTIGMCPNLNDYPSNVPFLALGVLESDRVVYPEDIS